MKKLIASAMLAGFISITGATTAMAATQSTTARADDSTGAPAYQRCPRRRWNRPLLRRAGRLLVLPVVAGQVGWTRTMKVRTSARSPASLAYVHERVAAPIPWAATRMRWHGE